MSQHHTQTKVCATSFFSQCHFQQHQFLYAAIKRLDLAPLPQRVIAAAGRDANDILAALRERMRNDPVTEARVAAAEHRKIARLRLEAMVQR